MKTVKYYCDVCEKPVSELYGVLKLDLTSPLEPQINACGEFCGFDCAMAWLKKKAGKKMIDPHIGRRVRYKPTNEFGVITSYNDQVVFVRYIGGVHSQATKREDLDYEPQ